MIKVFNNSGITLIALVITIVILLVLTGIAIATLGGENGLLIRATQAKQTQIKSEMKENLTLAIQEQQIEKTGETTLDDITQEWISEKIQEYKCTIIEDESINGKKVIMEKAGIIFKFLIDEDLNITEIEEDGINYYEITINLGEGISIDNTVIKVEYNKPYQATITCGDEYVIDTLTVTMGGDTVTVDKDTGKIDIEKVTGDIKIDVKSKLKKVYLYNNGDECIELTGGWQRGAYNLGTFTKESDHMNLYQNDPDTGKAWNSCQTVNKIDVTDYSTIYYKIKMDDTMYLSNQYLAWTVIGVHNPAFVNYDTKNIKAHYAFSYKDNDFKNEIITQEIDITDLNENVYPTISFNRWYSGSRISKFILNIDIYEVWLER